MKIMKTFTGKSRLALLLSFAGLLSFVAPQARADEEKDPPTRVARISFIEGSVSLQPGGEGDWGAAARNRPVTIGDKIWVDKDSRAELQAGVASIHLGSMTALSFLNLDAGVTQMRLAEGSVNFRVSELRQGDIYEVDAPNLAFVVKEAGAFRIDVDENGDSARVTVIRGEGEVTAGGKTYPVRAEERAEFTGTDNIESHFERAPAPDGLDRWAAERDLKEDNSVSRKYVSPDIPGSGDLDDYGTWRDEPEYGHVWYPAEVAPGWAPYSYGYWNYVGPWGWTWVDYSPWGFAPYHYGRWNYFAGGWGWCPGPYYGPAIYGPAFVGFLGGGFGFGVGVGVGWFPLGWGEPFYPWYRCGGGYIRNINIHNTYIRNTNVFNTNVNNFKYVNAHNINAVTVANRNTFASGQPINRGATHLTAASLRGAQVTNSVGVKPTPHSALGSVNARSNVARPPTAVQNRPVMARTAPAQGAAHANVRTFNSAGLTAGRTGNSPGNSALNQRSNSPNGSFHNSPGINGRPSNMPNNSGVTNRQQNLSQNRPPAAGTSNSASARASNGSRTWAAQGNVTDRGQAPNGFGRSNRPANQPAQTPRPDTNRPANAPTQTARADANRPPWARGNSQAGAASGQSSRPATPNYNSNRPNNSNNGRSYNSPQSSNGNSPSYSNRGYSQQRAYNPPPSRSYGNSPSYSNPGYSQPRSYNPPASRSYSPPTYSAPSRSYPAPSRSYSAPSRSYSGGGGGGGYSGGGGYRGGGGGGYGGGGGGGGSHGGGGGGSSHGGGSSPHGGGGSSHGKN